MVLCDQQNLCYQNIKCNLNSFHWVPLENSTYYFIKYTCEMNLSLYTVLKRGRITKWVFYFTHNRIKPQSDCFPRKHYNQMCFGFKILQVREANFYGFSCLDIVHLYYQWRSNRLACPDSRPGWVSMTPSQRHVNQTL